MSVCLYVCLSVHMYVCLPVCAGVSVCSCRLSAPLTLCRDARQQLSEPPPVGPASGAGVIAGQEPVTGQLVLKSPPPEAGRGGGRRAGQPWQTVVEPRLQIPAEEQL